jgi:hypothetical protein
MTGHDEHTQRVLLADEFRALSGRKWHWMDCQTSVAPAEEPGPCTCAGLDAERPTEMLAWSAP